MKFPLQIPTKNTINQQDFHHFFSSYQEIMKIHNQKLKIFLLLIVFLESRNVKAKNATWEGSKYQIECTMCSACDNPCNTPSPPPPPPPTPTTICPPPPSPPTPSSGGGGQYYYSPPPPAPPTSGGGQYYYQPPPSGGGGYYKPPPQVPTGPTPPPPNPIVPYFPYYYYNPPPSSSPFKKLPLAFSLITLLLTTIFY